MNFPKTVLCIYLSCCLCFSVRAQYYADSLNRLSTHPNDTLRINAYNALSQLNIPDSLSLADRWASRALSESVEIKYVKGILAALKNKGLVADYRGELSQAIQHYDAGILAAGTDGKWRKERIDFIVNKGVAYYYAGEMGQALKYYIEAEQALDGEHQNPTYAKMINNLAVVYRTLKRYPEAIRMYQKSLSLKEVAKDSLGIANTLNNIGLCYGYQNNQTAAVKYLKHAQGIYRSLGEMSEMLSMNVSLAVALHSMGQYAEPKKLLKEAFAFPGLRLLLHDLAQAKMLYARILYKDKEYQEALAVLKSLEPELIKTKFTKSIATFYESKAYVLDALHQPQEAYDALFQHKLYQDSLNIETKLSFEKDMEAKYLTKEKEAQIQIQNLQILKSKRERVLFTVALLALLLILGFAYRLSVQRKKANQLLGEKNNQIQQALEDKETLLKEIHHRVKNNLQIISSLLSLQSRRLEDPKALEAIQDGQNRVQSMALIHENLYQDANFVRVDATVYIDQLIENLIRSYNIRPENITFVKKIDPLKLDVDTLIPLGLILNELISNVLKYAFQGKESGRVDLSLSRTDQLLKLHIADDGQGMPPDFAPQNLKSLGYRLIHSFTKKLNGTVKTWNEQGANVEITFPNPNLG